MKYIKTAFFFLVAFAVIAMAPNAAFAITVSDNGSSAGSITTPSTQDNGSSAGSVSPSPSASPSSSPTPSVQTNGSSAGTITTPSTQNNGSSAGTVTTPGVQTNGSSAGTVTPPSTQNNGSSAGTVVTPSNPGSTNNGNASGPVGSSGSTSSSGSRAIYPIIGGCAFSTGYLKLGATGIEVTNLQGFLHNQGFTVAVTGVFDLQTLAAVKAFQVKYAPEVLSPWAIDYPTGYVYITTSKKINQISCATPLTLNPSELAIINASKAAAARGEGSPSDLFGSNTPNGSTIAVGTSTTHVSSNGTSSQVAAASQTGILAKIWNFIKRIFGR